MACLNERFWLAGTYGPLGMARGGGEGEEGEGEDEGENQGYALGFVTLGHGKFASAGWPSRAWKASHVAQLGLACMSFATHLNGWKLAWRMPQLRGHVAHRRG